MATTALPPYLKEIPGGLQLSLKVQPRASSNAFAGEHGPELRIRLTAPPVDSAANTALVEFLADAFCCPRNQITLLRGGASRHKIVLLRGLTAAAVLQKLSEIT